MMNIYQHTPDDLVPADTVAFLAHAGYTLTDADTMQAAYYAAPQGVTISGAGIVKIDTGLTLDEAHAALTDGLTKAELVELGADFGLVLSDSSLKAELLADIRAHLEGLS
jgi:hypothetical protein